MDKLDEIFDMQRQLDAFIAQKRQLHYSNEEWIQKKALALLAEVTEVLDEVNYKWWKNPKEVNDVAVKEELVDVFHFFVSMCINAGMSAQELFQIYQEKNGENFNRQNGLSDKKGYL